ncbi:MAG: thiamine pyrophosphate-binding protein [Elusimicrobiota bacterium]|jgi:acetolactate synthase-1/2/3 large subunit|nr:thiamine pyrophosphate-binding protein [Elusimicrobiota bacterium]
MIKLSDYIAKELENYGVKDVFMISGGGAMHLNDSFGHSKMRYICNHNEQATAIAAEGYARLNQNLAVVCVTTGPGGINALNGVLGQWTDSAPVLYISGQVKFSTTLASCPNLPLRQLGDQEADIISIVKPITKYAAMVKDPAEIKYHLQKAIYLATNGRSGPVWLDIPLNVQAALIDEKKLKSFKAPKEPKANLKIKEVFAALKNAKRPLIVAGHGIRLAGARESFNTLIKKLGLPVATTFNGFDLIENASPYFVGRIGTVGQRAGNFALQNADVVLFLGTRNNIRQVSYNWENFAKKAKKIVVDIDRAELKKPTIKPDIAINANLADFIPALNAKISGPLGKKEWTTWCKERVKKYPPLAEFKIKDNAKVNPYFFTQTLTELAPQNAVVVASNATACLTLLQAGVVKSQKQRMFSNSGDASMGYGLPAAIGAALAASRNVYCLEGDGSIMMNLQELQTVKNYNLPIKIFILNNNGYISIKQTQKNFFKRLCACGKSGGVIMPDFTALAKTLGLPAVKISRNKNLKTVLKNILAKSGPLVCEVMLEEDYTFSPKLSAKKLPDGTMVSPSLEDMSPFLSKEEFESNIIK